MLHRVFDFKGKCVILHLLYHCQQSVCTGLCQMRGHAYLLNELQVGINDLIGCMVGKHSNKHAYQSFYNDGITIGFKMHFAIGIISYQPYGTLTTAHLVLIELTTIFQYRQLFTQVNYVFVFIVPRIEQ